MNDDQNSMGNGFNMGGMNYMNEYGDEVAPTMPGSQVTPQMMQNQFYPPDIQMKSSEKSRHKDKNKKDKKKKKKDKKKKYSDDSEDEDKHNF